ncbi:hypothetical protein CNEO_60036 [Clostridium neonatale]|uniref:Uncharacterized protein n=1 Tax=Clostridium neonatale TaxID=137838 RepID=A0AA86JX64_9CLOT|nr:hypothetical protein CNEO_50016 [Clostridium neonatale]CAG9713849.1 hypothetical protein CNEO_60036 [Clostridium neonatale]
MKNILTKLDLNIINVYEDYKQNIFNNKTSRNIVLTLNKSA